MSDDKLVELVAQRLAEMQNDPDANPATLVKALDAVLRPYRPRGPKVSYPRLTGGW